MKNSVSTAKREIKSVITNNLKNRDVRNGSILVVVGLTGQIVLLRKIKNAS